MKYTIPNPKSFKTFFSYEALQVAINQAIEYHRDNHEGDRPNLACKLENLPEEVIQDIANALWEGVHKLFNGPNLYLDQLDKIKIYIDRFEIIFKLIEPYATH